MTFPHKWINKYMNFLLLEYSNIILKNLLLHLTLIHSTSSPPSALTGINLTCRCRPAMTIISCSSAMYSRLTIFLPSPIRAISVKKKMNYLQIGRKNLVSYSSAFPHISTRIAKTLLSYTQLPKHAAVLRKNVDNAFNAAHWQNPWYSSVCFSRVNPQNLSLILFVDILSTILS